MLLPFIFVWLLPQHVTCFLPNLKGDYSKHYTSSSVGPLSFGTPTIFYNRFIYGPTTPPTYSHPYDFQFLVGPTGKMFFSRRDEGITNALFFPPSGGPLSSLTFTSTSDSIDYQATLVGDKVWINGLGLFYDNFTLIYATNQSASAISDAGDFFVISEACDSTTTQRLLVFPLSDPSTLRCKSTCFPGDSNELLDTIRVDDLDIYFQTFSEGLFVNRFSVSGCALSTSSQVGPSNIASNDLLITNSSSPMLVAVYNFKLDGENYGNVTATVLDSTLNPMYSFSLPGTCSQCAYIVQDLLYNWQDNMTTYNLTEGGNLFWNKTLPPQIASGPIFDSGKMYVIANFIDTPYTNIGLVYASNGSLLSNTSVGDAFGERLTFGSGK